MIETILANFEKIESINKIYESREMITENIDGRRTVVGQRESTIITEVKWKDGFVFQIGLLNSVYVELSDMFKKHLKRKYPTHIEIEED